MAEEPISRFPVPELTALPGDIRERILAVQEKSGFIPNVNLTLAHRPDEIRAFFAYHDALMEKESGLTKAERARRRSRPTDRRRSGWTRPGGRPPG